MALYLCAVASWTATVLVNAHTQSCPSSQVSQKVFLRVAACLVGERTFAVVDVCCYISIFWKAATIFTSNWWKKVALRFRGDWIRSGWLKLSGVCSRCFHFPCFNFWLGLSLANRLPTLTKLLVTRRSFCGILSLKKDNWNGILCLCNLFSVFSIGLKFDLSASIWKYLCSVRAISGELIFFFVLIVWQCKRRKKLHSTCAWRFLCWLHTILSFGGSIAYIWWPSRDFIQVFVCGWANPRRNAFQ